MMLLSSPHSHTTYGDGKSSAEEMVLAAIDKGFQSLGFSEHARQLYGFPGALTLEREKAYRAEVRALQQKYAGRIRIWLGTEYDLFACSENSTYDYFIGSLHYLPTATGLIAVDGEKDALLSYIQTHYHSDGLSLAEDYFALYGALMRAHRPPIGGHFDLVRKNNAQGEMFDESAPRYRKAALLALEAAHESNVILEVNTGGIARYHAKTPYPDQWLLSAWHEMGGEVILASDCHYAPDLDTGFAQAKEILKAVGYEKARVLGTGNELFAYTPLD